MTSFLEGLNPVNVFYNDNPTVKGAVHDATGGAQAFAHPLGTKKNPSPLGSTVHHAENIGSGIGSIATFVTSGENWIRIGEVIAGVILIVMGLRTLAGHDTTPLSAATGTVKTAAKVAR